MAEPTPGWLDAAIEAAGNWYEQDAPASCNCWDGYPVDAPELCWDCRMRGGILAAAPHIRRAVLLEAAARIRQEAESEGATILQQTAERDGNG